MVRERVNTGGVKEFHPRDSNELGDTHSTREFKRVLRESRNNRQNRKVNNTPLVVPQNRAKKLSKNMVFLIMVLSILLIICILYFAPLDVVKSPSKNAYNNTSTDEPSENQALEYDTLPVKNSFQNYIDDAESYHNSELSLYGFIEQATEKRNDRQYFVEYLVDDLGNRIRIYKFGSSSVVNNPRGGALFNITGILKARPSKIDLEVYSLNEIERPFVLVEIKKEESKDITEFNESSIINHNVSKGWTKLVTFLNKSKNKLSNTTSEKLSVLNDYINETKTKTKKAKEDYIQETKTLAEKMVNGGCPSGEYMIENECYPFNTVIEVQILSYTNSMRRENGRKELEFNPDLSKLARLHSEDMVRRGYFSHTNPDGDDPTGRAKRMGIHYGVGENIGQMPTGDVIGIGSVSNNPISVAKAHVLSWMQSPGHRDNILYRGYSRIGVGVAYDGLYYTATQNFA